MMEPEEIKRWQRHLANLIKQAGSGDAEQFATVVRLLDSAVGDGLRAAADNLRQPQGDQPGYSWTELGNALGVSRQAAQQRFGTRKAVAS